MSSETSASATQLHALLSQTSAKATDGDRDVDPQLAAHARHLAAQGAVLLDNHGALPVAAGARVAVFGRTQIDWIGVGYGSGGDVNAPYVSTLLDSLRQTGAVQVDEELAAAYEEFSASNPATPGDEWGAWPFSYPEMPLDEDLVRGASRRAQTAIVVIGRAAGEDRENLLEPGSYYLTESERAMLTQVTEAFERTVVVIDTGSVIDLSWSEELAIDALLIAWLGGMEGARAIADILTGAIEPGGRLTDTIPRRYEDCPSADHVGDPEANDYVEDVYVGYRYFETFDPDAVLYPFGAGLGYTTFAIDASTSDDGETVGIRATVTNTGQREGSEVVQAYVAGPQGPLGVPARQLVGFVRTGTIAPGESETVEIQVPLARLAVYDDSGASGHRSAWVLQAGTHRILVGADVRSAREAGELAVPEQRVIEQLAEAAAPRHPFDRLTAERGEDGAIRRGSEPVPLATVDLRSRILAGLPCGIPAGTPSVGPAGTPSVFSAGTPDAAPGSRDERPAVEPEGPLLPAVGIEQARAQLAADPAEPTFAQVAAGEVTIDAFIASLAPADLAALSYGDITMDSPLGAAGNAGALGGVTGALRARGIPAAITTDGPSGIRLSAFASLLPCGTALASTWDPAAVRELAALHAREMIALGSDVLLSPGMNIHRDPLCGRNFEYFSEDPLVTGTMATAIVDGVQSRAVAACPKHFAANNQETNRIYADSRVSERALREIYLRGFEQVVREARPRVLMTSYNRINGVWGHYHYDLVTTILRGQWGFEGVVVTDWWMRMAPDPDFPALADSAYRVRAGVDVLMPGSIAHGGTEREDSVLASYGRPEGITLGEMQAVARRVLTLLLSNRTDADRAQEPPRG